MAHFAVFNIPQCCIYCHEIWHTAADLEITGYKTQAQFPISP